MTVLARCCYGTFGNHYSPWLWLIVPASLIVAWLILRYYKRRDKKLDRRRDG